MLYKTMGKRAYSRLRDVFPEIPSRQTLQLALEKIPLTAGLNPFILRHLESVSLEMSAKDKVCILMWDEVSIQSNVTYDIWRDIICGLEDWGNNRTSKVADHVLVFLLRGLHTGWKMPVSYNFCSKTTSTAQLVRNIKEHVDKISKAGFFIVATVCDQGTCNVAAIKELVSRTDIKRNREKRVQGKFYIYNIKRVKKCVREYLYVTIIFFYSSNFWSREHRGYSALWSSSFNKRNQEQPFDKGSATQPQWRHRETHSIVGSYPDGVAYGQNHEYHSSTITKNNEGTRNRRQDQENACEKCDASAKWNGCKLHWDAYKI